MNTKKQDQEPLQMFLKRALSYYQCWHYYQLCREQRGQLELQSKALKEETQLHRKSWMRKYHKFSLPKSLSQCEDWEEEKRAIREPTEGNIEY